jgi:hypothetical protein
MTDRIIIQSWWLVTLSMVAGTAIGCALSAYCGLFDLIQAHWSSAGTLGSVSLLLGSASYLLCRYRSDLVGD